MPDWAHVPPWFRDKMERLSLEVPKPKPHGECERLKYFILGLMRVTHRGSTWNRGPLTEWTAEGQVLMDTYSRPCDGGVAKIVDAVELSEPYLIKDRHLITDESRLPRMFFSLRNVFLSHIIEQHTKKDH